MANILRDDIIRRWNDTTEWQVDGFGKGMRVHDVNDPADICIFPLDGTHDEQGNLTPYIIVKRTSSTVVI